MEQIENIFTHDAATDEPAVTYSTPRPDADEHAEPWLYWAGVADGIRKCGGIVPPHVLEQLGTQGEAAGQTDDGRNRLDFEAVPVRARHDGWTPAKQRQFIEELADCGIVRRAAAVVGMTEQSVNRLRRRSDARAFDIACDAAQRLGARRLHSIAWERAIEGTVRRHHYHGEVKSEERIYDNRLLTYLLGRTRRFDQPAPEAERVLKDWDGWMDAIEQGLPEPARMETEPEQADPDSGKVWQDSDGQWWTSFPPPEDFDGNEHGDYEQLDYRRSLSDAEQEVIDADLDEEFAEAEARRDRYFGFDGAEDFSSMQAEPSSPSDELSGEEDAGGGAEEARCARTHPLPPPSSGRGREWSGSESGAFSPLPAEGREGLGVGAAEALGGPEDGFDDAVDVVDDIGVPEADDSPALAEEEAGASLVASGIGMLSAVDLDDQPRLAAGEIDDVGRDRKLAGEAGMVLREPAPEHSFAVGGVGAEVTGF